MNDIDPATQEYYDNYLDLFAHPGWIQFIDELRTSLEQDMKTSVSRCDTGEKWMEERGSQSKVLRVLGFENAIKNALDSLNAPSDSDEE